MGKYPFHSYFLIQHGYHYEFHIESVGMYSPESIFFRAIDVLKKKIKVCHELLNEKSKK